MFRLTRGRACKGHKRSARTKVVCDSSRLSTTDILRFLAFEQCFKKAMTGLPLGGAKGESDFDPKGRTDAEIMRFCQAFTRHLAPFVGQDRENGRIDYVKGANISGYRRLAKAIVAQGII